MKPSDVGSEFSAGRFVLAQVLVGELEIHLEEDRHEVVPAQTACLAPGDQRSNRGELVAAKRLTGGRQNRGGLVHGGLRQRRGEGRSRRRAEAPSAIGPSE